MKDKIRNIMPADDALVVITREPTGREVLTQIALEEGTAQNEEITPAKTNALPKTRGFAAAGRSTNSLAAARPAKTGSKRLGPGAPGAPAVPGARPALNPEAAAGAAAEEASVEDMMPDWFDDRGRNYFPAGPNVAQFESETAPGERRQARGAGAEAAKKADGGQR